jgi:hypothetical protein
MRPALLLSLIVTWMTQASEAAREGVQCARTGNLTRGAPMFACHGPGFEAARSLTTTRPKSRALLSSAACPSADWSFYPDEEGTEGHPSCLLEINANVELGGMLYVTPAFASNYCKNTLDARAHLVTIKGRFSYTPGGEDMFSYMIDNVVQETHGLMGCSQSPRVSFGASTAALWTWVDGTSSGNLFCPDPQSGCPTGRTPWASGEPRYPFVHFLLPPHSR